MRRLAGLAAALALAPLLAPRPAAAAVQLSFNKDNTVRVTSAAIQGSNGAAFPGQRLYYIRDSTEVYSATTVEGLTLVEDNGLRLSSRTVPLIDIAVTSITGVSVLPLTGGGFRMAYSVVGTTGAYNIYTATSADGLGWANDTGTAIVGNATFAGLPSLVKLQSGDWAMFYVQNIVPGGVAPDKNQIFRSLSVNEGRNWSAGVNALAQRAGEVSATKLTNNRVRLYYTAPVAGSSSNTTVLSALSADANAVSFSVEPGIRLSTSPGTIMSPFVERSTDSWRWRMYYAYSPIGLSTGDAFSAVTDAPQPAVVSPSSVLTNKAAGSSLVTGEVFSTGLTALLRQSGQADIPAAGLVRSDDQNFTATFNTFGAATGFWDVVVTNSNGVSTTLTNGVFVDFPGGSVTMTDNLLRPRSGLKARADITTFAAGRITAKLYTLDGRPVATLFDGDQPAGTLTLTWGATNASGATVASGVYLLRVTGPKLDNINKIVVIK